jgi:hypothetical protein
MTARPWKPAVELDGALERGDLPCAIKLATEVAEDRGRPIDLDIALGFLPLIAVQQPANYDAWALRWLDRWISEGQAPRSSRPPSSQGAWPICLPSPPRSLPFRHAMEHR